MASERQAMTNIETVDGKMSEANSDWTKKMDDLEQSLNQDIQETVDGKMSSTLCAHQPLQQTYPGREEPAHLARTNP